MRDIRSDLQDRLSLIETEINAAQEQFDKRLEQLKHERDGRLEGLKGELEAISKLLEAEYRRLDGQPFQAEQRRPEAPQQAEPRRIEMPSPQQPEQRIEPSMQATPAAPTQPLPDFFMRRIGESGPVSKDDLRIWAMRAGYFNDPDSAVRGVHAALVAIMRAGRVRELPNGTLALATQPTTLTEAIRARRAV